MKRSVASRARFENQPIDRLYRGALTDTLKGAIASYEQNGDRSVFKEAVEKTIGASLRDVDGLLGQGRIRKFRGWDRHRAAHHRRHRSLGAGVRGGRGG